MSGGSLVGVDSELYRERPEILPGDDQALA